MITTMRGTRRGINMDYMNYKTIQVMKKSERTEILFATVDGMEKPVVIKRLAEANPEIYREVAEIESPHIPKIYCVEKQENVLVVAGLEVLFTAFTRPTFDKEMFIANEVNGEETYKKYLREIPMERVTVRLCKN